MGSFKVMSLVRLSNGMLRLFLVTVAAACTRPFSGGNGAGTGYVPQCDRSGYLPVRRAQEGTDAGTYVHVLRLRGGFDVAGANAGYMREMIEVPAERIGMIIGRQGATIREIGRQAGVDIWVDAKTNIPGNPQRFIHMQGPPENIAAAKNLVREYVECDDAGARFMGHANGNLNSFSGTYHSYVPAGANQEWKSEGGGADGVNSRDIEGSGVSDVKVGQDGNVKIQMMIPDEWVGSIIGKGGATLKSLIHATGTKIWIPGESPQGSDLRPITISGPPSGVAKARQMITLRVRPLREAARHGGLGPMPAGGFQGTPFYQPGADWSEGTTGPGVGGHWDGGVGVDGQDLQNFNDIGGGWGVGTDGGSRGAGDAAVVSQSSRPYIWGQDSGPNPYIPRRSEAEIQAGSGSNEDDEWTDSAEQSGWDHQGRGEGNAGGNLGGKKWDKDTDWRTIYNHVTQTQRSWQ